MADHDSVQSVAPGVAMHEQQQHDNEDWALFRLLALHPALRLKVNPSPTEHPNSYRLQNILMRCGGDLEATLELFHEHGGESGGRLARQVQNIRAGSFR